MTDPVWLKPYALDPDDREALEAPVEGRGGFQALVRSLQSSVNSEGVLLVLGSTFRRMERYAASANGTGGFQGRLRALADKIAAENGITLDPAPQREMFR